MLVVGWTLQQIDVVMLLIFCLEVAICSRAYSPGGIGTIFLKKKKMKEKEINFLPIPAKGCIVLGEKRVLVRLKGVLRCALLCNLRMALLSLFFILPSDA